MRIIQVLSNSAVLVRKNNEKLVVFGKGIGFNKSKGDLVNLQDIHEIYVEEKNIYNLFSDN